MCMKATNTSFGRTDVVEHNSGNEVGDTLGFILYSVCTNFVDMVGGGDGATHTSSPHKAVFHE